MPHSLTRLLPFASPVMLLRRCSALQGSARAALAGLGTTTASVALRRSAAHRWHSTEAPEAEPEPLAPSLLVLGGNGFVGSAVCAAAVSNGMRVSSLSRTGRPGWYDKLSAEEQDGHWATQVEWKSGDVFDAASLKVAIGEGAERIDSLVSTIGAFGSYDFMVKMCGQATIGAVEVAKELGVPRVVFISAHDYGFPVRNVVSGYYDGKQNAERAIAEIYGENGASLRASAVYGKRILPGEDGKTIPLHVRHAIPPYLSLSLSGSLWLFL